MDGKWGLKSQQFSDREEAFVPLLTHHLLALVGLLLSAISR